GQTKYTTAKVIVARSFPGPGSGKAGRLPLVRTESFHGTHVAGIAAGVQGTVATAGPDHPTVSGLSGIAPRAWIGNYRVFNTPVLIGGYDAFTPQIVSAFESAVEDGMDVINFSGGGPEPDPTSDALLEATDNVAAAGVVPVISAGNDRDDFGLGSIGSPSNAPDAISVAAVSNLHVFGPELTVTAAGAPASLQAAGGTGMVLVDNRAGEANFIGVVLPGGGGGMISDLDGANLRAFIATHGGRTTFRSSSEQDPHEIQTGRSGIVTSFSSAGPTSFDHKLKPDLAAPGGQILSSTLSEFAGAPFA